MSNVFIKDKNITVKFPDDMSSDEIGNIIRKNIYGEDLEKTPDSFPDKVVSGVKSTWRGIQEPIFSSPTVAGALMQEIGETFESGPTQEDFTLAMGGIPGPAIFNMVKRQVGKRTNIDENIANAGKELISHNQDFLKNRQIKPEEGKINEFLFNLGSGVTSLASALAITKITGSPHAAATLFGVLQKGRIYKEAIESGKTPEESARLSYVAGGAEAGLEYIGLHFMLEKYGGRFRRMAIRSGIEGLQEFLQTTSENVIVRLGGIDKARNILEGAGQSALIGFILGSPASVAIDLAERNGVKEALLKTGIDEESANKVLSKVVEAVRKETGKVTAEEVSIMNNKANEVKPEEAELAPREVSDKVPLPKGELGGAKQKVRADLNEAGFDIGIANKAIESGKSFEEVLSFITGSVGKDKDIMVNTVGFSENLRAIMEAGETLDIETPTPSPEQQADPLTQEALKYDTAEEFVNANIGEDKFKFGGESVFHETSPDAAVGFGNVVVDKSGMFVSDDPAFALGQKGKGALVEFDKEHLKSDRGVLSKAKVLANEIFRGLGQAPKEFILHGGSASPTTVKSITIKPDTKLQPRNLKTLKRCFNQEQLEDGSVKFTPKWLDNRTQQLTDIYNKAKE